MPPKNPWWTWLAVVGAVAILAALYLSNLSTMGLVSVDEPRYADIGRAMATSGDWITPRLFGSPWFEKPPLLYWMVAIGFKLGLGPETAPRLPVALAGLGFLAFYWLRLRRLWDTRAATWATAMLATSAGWMAYSRIAITDIPLAVLFNVALLASLTPGRRNTLLAAMALGMAMLAKSLLPLVLFFPVLVLALRSDAPRRLREWLSPAPLLLFVACALPWHVLCYSRNGWAFIQVLFVDHQFGRAVSTALQHAQKPWFYLPVLAMLLFPWFPLVALIRPDRKDPSVRTLLSVTLFGFVFLSAVINKLPHYVLPLVPPLCALMGRGVARSQRPQWALAIPVGLLGLLPVAAQVLPNALAHGLRATPVVLSGAAWWIFAALGAWAALAAWRGPKVAVIAPLSAATAYLWLQSAAFPNLDLAASARPLWVREHPACLSSPSRATGYGLSYYAHRLLPPCSPNVAPLDLGARAVIR